jgi:hypothetical protein
MAAIAEFENQDWVQDILQTSSTATKAKAYVDPNIAFPFQDNFLLGTIHSTNAGNNESTQQQAASDNNDTEGVIEILDNDDGNDMSVLTSKTQDELVALLVQARKQLSNASAGSRVASGSDLPPGSGSVAMPSPTNLGGQESTLANSAPSGTNGNGVGRNASSGPGGK